jgi:hypothetical protein
MFRDDTLEVRASTLRRRAGDLGRQHAERTAPNSSGVARSPGGSSFDREARGVARPSHSISTSKATNENGPRRRIRS